MLAGALCLSALAQEEPAADSGATAAVPAKSSPRTKSDASLPVLPRKMVVTLKAVQQFFPAVTRELNTGANPAPIGNPKASRMVVYATNDASKKVILSVDDYENPSEAWLAYQQALKKSDLPQFTSIAVSNVGQQVVAGTITEGGETHTQVTTLDGALLVAGTLAGFDATTEDIGKLVELTREELSEAKAHAGNRRIF